MPPILFCRSISRVGTFIGKQTSINSACKFSNMEADTFKLQEFAGKYLGNKKVLFTERLEFRTPKDCDAMPIYRCVDSNGNFLDENEEPKFTKVAQKIYMEMTKLNTMDKILYESQRQGRISFYMTSYGEEASHLGSAAALEPRDLIYGQYRETGVLLWRGFSLDQCMNQCYGNKLDPGKTNARSLWRCWTKLRYHKFTSDNTITAGSAYSFKLSNSTKSSDQQRIVCVYFGEGAASEGDAHAAFNFAATLKCPVIFFCRNNGYAISTPTSEQYSGDGIAGKGIGYGIHTIRVDGNDVFAVYNATKAARVLALTNCPVLIEAMTYRLGHHSTSDDSTAYRFLFDKILLNFSFSSADEVKEWTELDLPILRYRKFLESKGWWNMEMDKQWISKIKSEVLESFNKAEKVKKLPPDELFNDVYAEIPEALKKQKTELLNHLEKYGEKYPELENFEK
ncbi:unnamed protein product [Meloidogyne enterolobii]|uniref:Uncharacterized protein n=1 Tax=Meloidogyne enterolobii TaxID=390850 RepID=A0ACB1ATT2_MELEN